MFAAEAPCGASALSASGYFFDTYERVEYSESGYLTYHFRNLPQYSDGRAFKIQWSYLDDECNPETPAVSSQSISLPAGVVDWSVRFTSSTHFDVWDDQNETILAGVDIPAFPLYSRVSFEGSVDARASTFTAQTLHIYENALPPSFQNLIEKPVPCAFGSASGYYFDSSENAEYVEGLLRVHLRLKTPHNDGRSFQAEVVGRDEECAVVSAYSSPAVVQEFTPFVRYVSFRMTSPTGFVLWNDEADVAFECEDCAGELPSRSAFVSFSGSIDGGASTIQTTPFSPTEFQECCSSVLFLPGIKGSRLYREVDGVENKIWEPDMAEGNDDVRSMFLDANGKSIGSVYVKEEGILDSAGGKEYYQSFISDMDTLKSDGVVANWQPVAYDWRLSLDDIVGNGSEVDGKIFYDTPTTTPYIEQTLRALAARSQTGKVTIIAHSNGGLVAKALLKELGDAGAQALVDNVIFVGVPQSGAPQSIGSLLYGYREGIPDFFPIVVKASTAREFAENSPMGYHLLPSEKYFDDTKDINHPVVVFDGKRAFEKERAAYGLLIGNSAELSDFLLAREEGREKPLPGQIGRANVLNSILVDYAKSLHETLDAWVPPENITLYQIAGWGENTVAGIEFYDTPQISALTAVTAVPAYRPLFVEDGDGVVPVPSALMTSTSTENVKRYWVDLAKLNRDKKIKTDHGNILEVSELRQFIKNILDETKTLTNYVQTEQPSIVEPAKKLRFFLHSPLTLELYDSSGNHAGLNTDGTFDQEILDVEYGEFGDVQYIIAPQGPQYRLVLNGLDLGTFSLDIQEVEGDTLLAQTTLANIPTTPDTTAVLEIGDGIQTASELEVDEDGNGTTDITLQSQSGETVFYKEPETPSETPKENVVVPGGGGPIWDSVTIIGIVAGTSTAVLPDQVISVENQSTTTATTTPAESGKVSLPEKPEKKKPRINNSATNFIQETQTNTQTASVFQSVSQQRWFSHFVQGVYNGFLKLSNSLFELFKKL